MNVFRHVKIFFIPSKHTICHMTAYFSSFYLVLVFSRCMAFSIYPVWCLFDQNIIIFQQKSKYNNDSD